MQGGMPQAGMMGGNTGMPSIPHAAMNNHHNKTFRELHIGNTAPGLTPPQLQQFLNAAMHQGELITGEPGMCVTTTRCAGKFAFAEFRSVEECNNALNLNGIVLMGRPLRVARPRNYMGPEITGTPWHVWMTEKIKLKPELEGKVIGMPDPAELAAMAAGGNGMGMMGGGAAGNSADRSVRDLYIGNTPEFVTDVQLLAFISGAMREAKLTDDPQPIVRVRLGNGRFAFAEFKTPELANRALNMNGIEFSGNPLRFNRPKSYTGPTTHSVTWTELLQLGIEAVESGAGGRGGMGGGGMGGGGYGGHGGMMMGISGVGGMNAAFGGRTPTRALQLSNMITAEELESDEEFKFIVEDVATEMTKYAQQSGGTLEDVQIPRDGPGVGHIYVLFSNLEAAVEAHLQLPTRKFGEQFIKAAFYPEAKLKGKDFTDVFAEEAATAAKQKEMAAATAAALGSRPPPVTSQAPPILGGGGRGIGATQQLAPAGNRAPPILGGGIVSAGVPGEGRGRGRGRTLPAWMTQ
jgi:splicing factor U2AF subunit